MEIPHQPTRRDPIGDLVVKHLPKFEIVLILNIILAAFLHSKEPTLGNILMLLSFTVLILLYFIMTFKERGQGNGVSRFGQKLGYFSLGVTVLGIYFKIMHWPMTSYLILGGTLFLALAMIMAALASVKSWNQKVTLIIVRGMLAIITASVLLQTI